MIHPDRLKGMEMVEKTEPIKDRDTYPTHSHPQPSRQEQKPSQIQQQHRAPIGLVSTSASATGVDESHDTSPASHNNSVVGGDSSPWNAPQPVRPTHANISPAMAHKQLPIQSQTPTRQGSSLEKPQHSLSSILNPDGVGSNGGYTFGANNSSNLPMGNTTTATATGTGFIGNTSIQGPASTNTFSAGTQQTSPQAALPVNVPSTPTMSTAILMPSASSPPSAPTASPSLQVVKQVPTGPRAERANHPHLPHGHGHAHLAHLRGSRGSFRAPRGGSFRGRVGEGTGMIIKREVDDDPIPGIGSGYRGGRGGGDWIAGRGRGAFEGRGSVGRRDARFGSVDRMESNTPGSLGGVAGVVGSAIGKGSIAGSLMRRNSDGGIETLESGVDKAFEGREKPREMGTERKDRFESGRDEIKVERVEGQPQPPVPFSTPVAKQVDNSPSVLIQRPEVLKSPVSTLVPLAMPVVSQILKQEPPPQPQMVTTIQEEDRMDIDDSDDEVLTQADVVSKMEELDRELAKCKDRLAELDRKKQGFYLELQTLEHEEAMEVKEREREEKEKEERIEAARQERMRKEKEEKERLKKEKERLRIEKAERAERLRIEQEKEKEKEQERERLEKEKERERLEKEKLERERRDREVAEDRRKEREEKERMAREKKTEEERIEKEKEDARLELEQERAARAELERVEREKAEDVNKQVEPTPTAQSRVETQDKEMVTTQMEEELESTAAPSEPEHVKTEEDTQHPIKAEISEVPVASPVDEEVIMTDYAPAAIATPTEPAEEHETEEDREADADGEFEDDDGYAYDDGEVSSRSNQSVGSPTSFIMDDLMIPPPLADGEEAPFKIPTRAELESCLYALPHFRQGPKEPKDYAIFQETNEAHGKLKPILLTIMQENAKFVIEKERKLKEEYIEGYEPYLKELRKLENEEQGKKKPGVAGETLEPDASPTLVHTTAVVETATTATTTTTTTGRRGGRNAAPSDVIHSEAELEAIIQILNDQDAQAQADKVSKEKDGTEAVIPDMILDPLERKLQTYQDYSNLLTQDHDRKAQFGTLVPSDDWTEEEQRIFVERYMQTPKQWQKIADHLPGRTYKDCIRHYYLTKKVVGYKEKLRVPKRGKRKSAKSRNAWANGQGQPRTRQSKLINADTARKAAGTPLPPELKVTGEDDEGADSEDVAAPITDTGRPRRAAAPVFGGENSVLKQQELIRDDSESATPGPGNGKRSGGGGGGNNGNSRVNLTATGDEDSLAERGSKRARVGGTRKEGGKRTRTPAIPLAEKEKPTKEEKRKEELEAKESDAVNALAGLATVATVKGVEGTPAPPLVPTPIPILPQQPAIAPYHYNLQPNPQQVQQLQQDPLQLQHAQQQQVQTQQQHHTQLVVNSVNLIQQQQPDVMSSIPSQAPKPIMPGTGLQPSQNQRGQSQAPPSVTGPTQSLRDSQDPAAGPMTPKKEKQIAQTSSYWSVPEAGDFPQLLASYGTNWNSIASHLASKTPTMVCNF